MRPLDVFAQIMMHSPLSEKASSQLKLLPQLDLRAAKPLKDQLMPLLGKSGHLYIEAGEVTKVSTACVQVLVAFVIAARNAAQPLSFSTKSPAFSQSFALLGLSEFIEEFHP
ncbi:MAG: STAS domain-containing protein [Pseudomonadota bacterium]|nr:STAS domain-containing protein [Pseudomonadota bacterium]